MALDAIAGPVGGLGIPGIGGAAPFTPAPPAPDKVAAFEAILDASAAPPGAAEAGPDAAALPWETAVGKTSPTDAFVDRLAGGIDALREATSASRAEALSVLSRESAGPADLLRAQFALMESGTLTTLAGKVTEKITTAIKTLQQGQ